MNQDEALTRTEEAFARLGQTAEAAIKLGCDPAELAETVAQRLSHLPDEYKSGVAAELLADLSEEERHAAAAELLAGLSEEERRAAVAELLGIPPDELPPPGGERPADEPPADEPEGE